MNHMIHTAATTRSASTPKGYDRRKLAAGKTRAEGIEAGPGGHRGASHESSAAGSHPHTGTSDQPLPGPAPKTLPAPEVTRKIPTSRHLEPAS
jgi:transposase